MYDNINSTVYRELILPHFGVPNIYIYIFTKSIITKVPGTRNIVIVLYHLRCPVQWNVNTMKRLCETYGKLRLHIVCIRGVRRLWQGFVTKRHPHYHISVGRRKRLYLNALEYPELPASDQVWSFPIEDTSAFVCIRFFFISARLPQCNLRLSLLWSRVRRVHALSLF